VMMMMMMMMMLVGTRHRGGGGGGGASLPSATAAAAAAAAAARHRGPHCAHAAGCSPLPPLLLLPGHTLPMWCLASERVRAVRCAALCGHAVSSARSALLWLEQPPGLAKAHARQSLLDIGGALAGGRPRWRRRLGSNRGTWGRRCQR
jgi:hypothetical protein